MKTKSNITIEFDTKEIVDQLVLKLPEVLIKKLLEIKNDANKNEDIFLSRRQTAKLLLISLPTLDKLTREPISLFTTYRIGKQNIRYKKSEVELAMKNLSKSNKK